MTIQQLFSDLDIRPSVLETISIGPPASEFKVNEVLKARGIASCESYVSFLTSVGPISYGSEDSFYDLTNAQNATESKITNARYETLFGSPAWLCIAWKAVGYDFYVGSDQIDFPTGTVFMTTFERPLEKALIAASSPIALARLLAKAYEQFVLQGLWELQEDSSIRSEPTSIWPFASRLTGKAHAFRIDPGLQELDERFPMLSCFRELNIPVKEVSP